MEYMAAKMDDQITGAISENERLERENAQLRQDLSDARTGWESATEALREADAVAKRDDGGSAFPSQEQTDYASCSVTTHFPGMTLRDFFAAKAVSGICAHSDTWGLATYEKIAIEAYKLADAILLERAK